MSLPTEFFECYLDAFLHKEAKTFFVQEHKHYSAVCSTAFAD